MTNNNDEASSLSKERHHHGRISPSNKRETWLIHYASLVNFHREFGHCDIPQKWEPNPKLGMWVSNQRYHYKNLQLGKKPSLKEERLKMLNSLNFIWAKRTKTKLQASINNNDQHFFNNRKTTNKLTKNNEATLSLTIEQQQHHGITGPSYKI